MKLKKYKKIQLILQKIYNKIKKLKKKIFYYINKLYNIYENKLKLKN